jgi:Carboxypeptidase regulatory-like domain
MAKHLAPILPGGDLGRAGQEHLHRGLGSRDTHFLLGLGNLLPHRSVISVPRPWFVALALLSIPAVTHAATLAVSVVPVLERAAGPSIAVRVTLAPVLGTKPPQVAEVQAPGVARFEVAPGSAWRATVEAPGFWTAPRVLTAGPAEAEQRLDLLPAGTIEGEIAVPPGQEMPREMTLRFQSAPAAARALSEVSEICPLDGRRLRCTLPVGTLDLHLRARGFVTQHRWGAEIAAGRTLQLGTLRLQPGASVVGWITAPERDFRFAECSVELAPLAAGAATLAEDVEREGSLTQKEKVNPRGFFEMTGVPPGSYRLIARHPAYAVSRVAPVEVMPGAETHVPPIELLRPARLAVQLEPPIDPYGNAWKVELLRSEVPGSADLVVQSVASAEGAWQAPDLEPGPYVLRVHGSYASVWKQEEVEVEPDAAPYWIRLPVVRVQGEVAMGGEPLRALLWFGGRHGAVKVAAKSDEDGRFEVTLPEREKPWRVDVVNEPLGIRGLVPSLLVRKSAGQSAARVAIDLPDTAVRGEVVDESGRPVPGARVRAGAEALGELLETKASQPEGRFELRGLELGEWLLEATDGRFDTGSSSEALSLQLASRDQKVEDVRLVLRQRIKLSGLVVGPTGQGVPVASILAFIEQEHRELALLTPQALTDVGGQFTLGLPAGTAGVVLTVFPPGFAATQMRIDARRSEPLVIPVHPAGGTVVVRFDEEPEVTPSARHRIRLFREHLLPGTMDLQEWATLNGQETGIPGRLVVPMLDPGRYIACIDPPPSVSRSGRLPAGAGGRCASGELSAYGELDLALPAAGDAPRRP